MVDQHARRLYRAARGLGFAPADADDLVQEVFLTFLETLERFDGCPALGAYYERLMTRPSVARVLVEAKPWFDLYPYREAIPARFL